MLTGGAQTAVGGVAGLGIGVVAALLGVAGGELLIPTLILLFGPDIKLAGSLSLAVSLPTMLVGFARYSRDRSFVGSPRTAALYWSWRPDPSSAASSAANCLVWCRTLSCCRCSPILVLSAVKVWRH